MCWACAAGVATGTAEGSTQRIGTGCQSPRDCSTDAEIYFASPQSSMVGYRRGYSTSSESPSVSTIPPPCVLVDPGAADPYRSAGAALDAATRRCPSASLGCTMMPAPRYGGVSP